MSAVFKLVEIRMGHLVFITKQGKLMGYNAQSGRFDLCHMTVTPEDRFIMAMSTCGGMLARSLDPDAELPIAMAHMQSLERGKLQLGASASYADVRANLNRPEVRLANEKLLDDLRKVVPDEAAQVEAASRSPIYGPDLLAQHVTAVMGQRIEVRLFGGQSISATYVPEVISGMQGEFQKFGVAPIIEESVLNLVRYGKEAMIAPYAPHSSDLVRPWGSKSVLPGNYQFVQLTFSG